MCKKYRAEPVKRFMQLAEEYERDESKNKSASKAKGLTAKVYYEILKFLHEYWNGKAKQAVEHSMESGPGAVALVIAGTDDLDPSEST